MSCFASPPQGLTLSPEPREVRGEQTSPAGFPGGGGKRGRDFKTAVTGVETEAPRSDWREEETAGQLGRGWGRKASPESQPPRPVLGGSQSGLLVSVPLPHPGVWLHCGWTPEGRRPEACDWV